VQTFVQKNPQLGFALILQLTGVHGNQQFDRLTKTKTIETILTSMDTSGIREYITFLLSQIDETDKSDKYCNPIYPPEVPSLIVEPFAGLILNLLIHEDCGLSIS
jgi:DNA polymerase phi